VSLSDRLRTILLCSVLEIGVMLGVPMPPERIRQLLQQMNQPAVMHVLRENDDSGEPPPDDPSVAR
jgi:hypothetical protein